MSEEELLEAGYKKYTGEKIDVFFNADVCQHSAKCVTGLPGVFNIHRKPWILLDEVNVEEVIRIIDSCPSGGLKYTIKDDL